KQMKNSAALDLIFSGSILVSSLPSFIYAQKPTRTTNRAYLANVSTDEYDCVRSCVSGLDCNRRFLPFRFVRVEYHDRIRRDIFIYIDPIGFPVAPYGHANSVAAARTVAIMNTINITS
ncbi:MAG TPA: hypothetical protein VG537_06935, partial [Candidatus Kapabacteria bacterium]|nr:hypothetical protein [Candidatus Kapabacteria bacterium]